MQIKHVIQTLSQEFALSQHPHSRKGGLIGLAACSIALGKVCLHSDCGDQIPSYLSLSRTITDVYFIKTSAFRTTSKYHRVAWQPCPHSVVLLLEGWLGMSVFSSALTEA